MKFGKSILGIIPLIAASLGFGSRSRALPPITPDSVSPPPFTPRRRRCKTSGAARRREQRHLQRSNRRFLKPTPTSWKNPFRGLAVPKWALTDRHAGRGEISDLAKVIAARPKSIVERNLHVTSTLRERVLNT